MSYAINQPVTFRNPVGTVIRGGVLKSVEGDTATVFWTNGKSSITYTVKVTALVVPEQFNMYGVDYGLAPDVDWLDAVLAKRQQPEVFNHLGVETRYGTTDGGDWLTIALQQRAAKVLRLAEAQSDGQDAAKQAA